MDLQLKDPYHKGVYAFVNEKIVGKKGTKKCDLVFVVEYVKWNPDTQANVTQSKELVAAIDFGVWYGSMRATGWILCD